MSHRPRLLGIVIGSYTLSGWIFMPVRTPRTGGCSGHMNEALPLLVPVWFPPDSTGFLRNN
jgi:hypothetical protein